MITSTSVWYHNGANRYSHQWQMILCVSWRTLGVEAPFSSRVFSPNPGHYTPYLKDEGKLWIEIWSCTRVLMESELIEMVSIFQNSHRPNLNGVSVEAYPSKREIIPIAIVCRFPGDAWSLERLSELCFDARMAWSEVLNDMFYHETFFHPNSDRNSCVSVISRLKSHV